MFRSDYCRTDVSTKRTNNTSLQFGSGWQNATSLCLQKDLQDSEQKYWLSGLGFVVYLCSYFNQIFKQKKNLKNLKQINKNYNSNSMVQDFHM